MRPIFSRNSMRPRWRADGRFQAIASVMLFCLLSTGAYAQGFTPGCELPFHGVAERHPIDAQCAVSGNSASPGTRLQDAAKNNFCASGNPAALDFADFAWLQRLVEHRRTAFGSARSLPVDRRPWKRIGLGPKYSQIGEGSLARLAGVVATAHYSAWAEAESVNCGLQGAENADIQVSVVPHAGDDLCKSVLVEISPHMRPAQWSELVQMKPQRPLRFTGQLFFDASHTPCDARRPNELKRISSWEIHPVYAIDVCKRDTPEQCDSNDDSVWTPLDTWKNERGSVVKLAFICCATYARVHEQMSLWLVLQDAASESASVDHVTTARVKLMYPSGKVEARTVAIQAGRFSVDLKLQLPEAGVTWIEADAPGLRSASMVINVLRAVSFRQPEAQQKYFQAAAYRWPAPTDGRELREPNGISRTLPVKIRVFTSPARELMANGSDFATVSAFVDGDVARENLTIRLHSGIGAWEPCKDQNNAANGSCPDAILVIPKGASSGFVQLRSDQTGDAKINYVPTQPNITIVDAPQVIQFGPPITKIFVQASPPRISLVDSANILVQLMDDRGTIYVPAHARRVNLSILRGEGKLESQDHSVVITPPNTQAATSFTPGFWIGAVDVDLTTDQLSPAHLRLYVTPPTWLLLFSVLGGLTGGGLAFTQNRARASMWRVPIGALTGFVFYWAFLFGVFSTKSAVLNPLSDFALSVIGGWLGTNIFALVLKQFGIVT